MPSASRIGDAILPHGCWTGGVIVSGSGNVFANGISASTLGDLGTPHSWICSGSNPPHTVAISSGSSSVFINGKPAARIGDATDCGSFVSSGSQDVLIGG